MAPHPRIHTDSRDSNHRRLGTIVSARAVLLVAISLAARPVPAIGVGSDPGSPSSAPAVAAVPPDAPQGARGPVKSLEVVILSTMLTDRAGLGEWGFSALIETDGRRILF